MNMKETRCIVVGGGYAGINAVKAIENAFGSREGLPTLRIILMDKHPYHLRKVLLFKPAAVENEEITVPLARLLPQDVDFIQATVTGIESDARRVHYLNNQGNEQVMEYDILVLAAGSIIRQPDSEQGGIALTGLAAAQSIRETWRANLRKATKMEDRVERERLMTITVAGAGISGIETSAELAYAAREDVNALGLEPNAVAVKLINANNRLFPDGPVKVGTKLERMLEAGGVTVLHNRKVLQEKDGVLTLSDGSIIPSGLCVWTLGVLPNPMLSSLGVPLTADGYIAVDASYRVQRAPGLYAIGDCAEIIDPASGLADGKTCKEATAQASRLAQVIAADLMGRPAPTHKRFMDFFCFGLGPQRGMAWTRAWGIDMIFTGKLGWHLREFTWKSASLLK